MDCSKIVKYTMVVFFGVKTFCRCHNNGIVEYYIRRDFRRADGWYQAGLYLTEKAPTSDKHIKTYDSEFIAKEFFCGERWKPNLMNNSYNTHNHGYVDDFSGKDQKMSFDGQFLITAIGVSAKGDAYTVKSGGILFTVKNMLS